VEINKCVIKSLLQAEQFFVEFEDFRLDFEVDGYFLGIYQQRLFLHDGVAGYASVWLRPYHLDYIKKIEVGINQKLLIECRGLKKNPKTGNNYFHLNFKPKMSFKELTPPATGDLQPGGQS
jgi:hypothetical protein